MKTVKSYTNRRFVLQIEYHLLQVPSITILTTTNLALKSPNLHTKGIPTKKNSQKKKVGILTRLVSCFVANFSTMSTKNDNFWGNMQP